MSRYDRDAKRWERERLKEEQRSLLDLRSERYQQIENLTSDIDEAYERMKETRNRDLRREIYEEIQALKSRRSDIYADIRGLNESLADIRQQFDLLKNPYYR